MTTQRGALFQEKVSRLLSRQNGRPVIKPNKPLVLKDSVAYRKLKKKEATCITEISVMMACWKQNNFVDGRCSNEIKSFYTCIENAQADMKNAKAETRNHGVRLPPKQATTLLKRYPNLHYEI
ncbi:hypothetical protein PAMP_001112 [Pampus punctatissimus]